MRITLWGTRGSLATPGPETTRYGGNTSCVQVEGEDGTMLVLDAGTGIQRLGKAMGDSLDRVDLLLTHLHMDHIQGLGFFPPLYMPSVETHVWGPASPTLDLRTRLSRYLSPPLFPVVLRDLPNVELHEVPGPKIRVGGLEIESAPVCHPGPTVGYRIEEDGAAVTYLPDHEPALGVRSFPEEPEWTSGYGLAEGADLLIHDAQYTAEEYPRYVGWGHSTLEHTMAFAKLAAVKHLVPFHHDPGREDATVEAMMDELVREHDPDFPVTPAAEGDTFRVVS